MEKLIEKLIINVEARTNRNVLSENVILSLKVEDNKQVLELRKTGIVSTQTLLDNLEQVDKWIERLFSYKCRRKNGQKRFSC